MVFIPLFLISLFLAITIYVIAQHMLCSTANPKAWLNISGIHNIGVIMLGGAFFYGVAGVVCNSLIDRLITEIGKICSHHTFRGLVGNYRLPFTGLKPACQLCGESSIKLLANLASII